MSHVLLQIFDFIWQQERIGHEPIVYREEALETADDHTKDVLFGKVVHQGIPIYKGTFHLDKLNIVVTEC